MNGIFVTGIGTGVGKTVTSAVLVRALRGNYWKPLQSGDLDQLDRETVRRLADSPESTFYPERYLLSKPLSPHAAAEADGISVTVADFEVPLSDAPLIVEGAGGLLVPLNDRETIADLMVVIGFPAVLVSRHYLGSINHTLMSLEVLRARRIPVAGILFVGHENKATERAIRERANCPILGRFDEVDAVTPAHVSEWASALPHVVSVCSESPH